MSRQKESRDKEKTRVKEEPTQVFPRSLKDSTYLEYLTNSLSSTKNSLLSYLPTSVSKSIPTSEENAKPKILWATFQSPNFVRTWAEKSSSRNLYLVIGSLEGVHIWDLCCLEEVKCIFNFKCGPVRCAKILNNPMPSHQIDQFNNSRPHMAVVCAENQGIVNVVKIVSLSTGEVPYIIRLQQEIFSISSNSQYLITCGRDTIHVYDLKNYKHEFQIQSCEPNPRTGGCVAALGSRWIAHSSSKPPQKLNTKLDKDVDSNNTIYSITAKDVASNLMYWGDRGMSYLYGQDKSQSASHGTLYIRDMSTRTTVSSFHCHDSPIAEISFNESGSLVATADINGQEINIFQIIPNLHTETKQTHVHFYKLIRGTSMASIESISFNTDSKWVSVCSARGTTHIFPISLVGEAPTVETHAGESLWNDKINSPKFPIVVNSLEKIHQATCIPFNESDLSKMKLSSSKMAVCAKFLHNFEEILSEKETDNEHMTSILTISPFGLLTFFTLIPHVSSSINNGEEVKELKIKSEALFEWDLCIKSLKSGDIKIKTNNKNTKENTSNKNIIGNWKEAPSSASSKDNLQLGTPKWLRNVEVVTFSPRSKPIWSNPQFSFLAYQKSKEEEEEGQSIAKVDVDVEEIDQDGYLHTHSISNGKRSEPIPYSTSLKEEDMRSAFVGSVGSPMGYDNLNFERDAFLIGVEDRLAGDISPHDQSNDSDDLFSFDAHHVAQSPDGDNELDNPAMSVFVEKKK